MELLKKTAVRIAAPAFLALHSLNVWAALVPNVEPESQVTDVTGLKMKIDSIVTTFIGIIGIISIAMLVYGGYLYVTAGMNEEQTKKAKTAILYALIGLAVAVLSYAIVNVVVDLIGS